MANNRTCVIYHAIDEEKKSEKNFLMRVWQCKFQRLNIILLRPEMDRAKTLLIYYAVLIAIKFTSGGNPCLTKKTQCICSNDRVDCSKRNITAIPSEFPLGTKQM